MEIFKVFDNNENNILRQIVDTSTIISSNP